VPPTSEPGIDPEALRQRLLALPVAIDEVRVRSGRVAIAGYQGGRPSGLLALAGRGVTGFGENVAFTADEQRAFAAEVAALLRPQARVVGEAVGAGPAHARAAVEAAVIDLALKQARLALTDLVPVAAVVPLRWVASFAAADPVGEARRWRAAGAAELKVDVDPAWSSAILDGLAGEPGLAILDFKDGGSPALCAGLRARFPRAIFEDPPAGYHDDRCSRDRPLLTPTDVGAAVGRGEGVNLKCPRMGGPLAVLQALAAPTPWVRYFGGMYEVGPGRAQARQLAALFCPGGPNDLGPIGPEPLPTTVRLDVVGFGATCDWQARCDQLANWSPIEAVLVLDHK
jgi:hypothetical protein